MPDQMIRRILGVLKVASNWRISIPAKVRQFLKIKPGDKICWIITKENVVMIMSEHDYLAGSSNSLKFYS